MAKRVSLKGKGADLFFGDYNPTPAVAEPMAVPGEPEDGSRRLLSDGVPSAALEADDGASVADPAPTTAAPRRDPASRRPTRRSAVESDDTMLASTLASTDASTIAEIRKVVRVPGREVSFVRLTPEEKALLTDIVYTYKRQGQRTSENEINRIALNYLLLDYQEHGEHSVLARVLAALQA